MFKSPEVSGHLVLIENASRCGHLFPILSFLFVCLFCSIPAAEARANLPGVYSGDVSHSHVLFIEVLLTARGHG